VAVANLKGGTAKTVTSYFLATALARRGRTLLVDCDPQGSALSWARAAEEGGGEVPFEVVGLPVRDVHRRIKGLASDFEHVVLDTPPLELPIVRSALLAAETVIVAIPPTEIDLDRVMATLDLVAEAEALNEGLTFRVLLTRVLSTARDGRDAREEMGEMEPPLPVMEAEVPALVAYSRAFGEPVGDLGAYEAVAAELLGEPVGAGGRRGS
jgi:chromosome partitioning protein